VWNARIRDPLGSLVAVALFALVSALALAHEGPPRIWCPPPGPRRAPINAAVRSPKCASPSASPASASPVFAKGRGRSRSSFRTSRAAIVTRRLAAHIGIMGDGLLTWSALLLGLVIPIAFLIIAWFYIA